MLKTQEWLTFKDPNKNLWKRVFAKLINNFKPWTIFPEKLHHSYLTGFYIRVWFLILLSRISFCLVDSSYFLCSKKVSKYGVFFGPYFPVFKLNTEIYGGNLRIQSEYRKIRKRKNSLFWHFSRSDDFTDFFWSYIKTILDREIVNKKAGERS